MPKLLQLAFTGTCLLTPEYPEDLTPIQGPLKAILPAGRRTRPSTFGNTPINAQFAVIVFDWGNLHVPTGDPSARRSDHQYPDLRTPTKGLCFLEREYLILDPAPLDTHLTFDDSPTTSYPTTASTATKWIASWSRFAANANANPRLKPEVWSPDFGAVHVEIPAGVVSAGFVDEPVPRINFDYGPRPETRPYAQEIRITLTYGDGIDSVTLVSVGAGEPSRLTFKWHDAPTMKLTFGNGSLASILSLLQGSFAGQDHQGDFDLEFEVTYDAVAHEPDHNGHSPLPRVMSNEVLRVPCISSMVASDPTEFAAASKEATGPQKSIGRDSKGRRTRRTT